jgi:hypothetical protein
MRELTVRTFPTKAPVQPGAFGLHARMSGRCP